MRRPAKSSGTTGTICFSPTCLPSGSAGPVASAIRRPAGSMPSARTAMLQCLDGETGREIWSHSMQEEFGGISVFGGRTNFPTVFDDMLLVSLRHRGLGQQGISPAHRFFGLDKNTGEVRWYQRHHAAARRHDLQHAIFHGARESDGNDLRLQRRSRFGRFSRAPASRSGISRCRAAG